MYVVKDEFGKTLFDNYLDAVMYAEKRSVKFAAIGLECNLYDIDTETKNLRLMGYCSSGIWHD